MKYNIGQTVYTISIIDIPTAYTIVGKIQYKILGITYKTRYACKKKSNGEERIISGRKLHRMITDNKE